MTVQTVISARWTHDVWLDGALVAPGQAVVPLMSHGLHYGTGVFEGIRFYGGKPLLLDQHMQRLIASGRAIGLTLPFDTPALCAAAGQVIARSGLRDGYLRPIAWFDDGGLGLHAAGLSAHVAMVVWEWPKVFQPEAGISLALSQAARATSATLPPQAKTTGGYLIGYLAHRTARAEGFDDALLLDSEGCLAETSSANFFAVVEGRLVTPRADRFLNGLTRQRVMQIAAGMGLSVTETRLHPSDIAGFSEAFVTGTAVEVTPVTRIGSHQMPVGALTQRLRDAYLQGTL